jgi:formylglycine-generating enzyme required for sulfatase activity
MLRAAVILLFLGLLPSQLCAEARIALLIGNQVYTSKVGVLRNPHEDVALVGAALKQLGFQVTILKDAGYRDLDVAIKRFIVDVRSKGRGAISFFYYSGHGAANPDTQINYLIPVDVADPNDGNLWYQSFQQNELIDRLSKQAPNATHYVVFDACRNELNLSGPAAKAIGAEKGFVPVPQTPGLLIAYATAQGKTASDTGDAGGPYAKALAAEILKPGIEAVTMFRNVQIRVKEDIGQDPWLSFPALPSVYLAGRTMEPATAPAPAQPVGAAEVVRVCREVEAMTSLSMLAVLERQHAGTPAADCISARIGELRAKADADKAAEEVERKRAAAEAERQRLALLDKQEEARKAAEAEAQRICLNVGGILNLEVLGALANLHKGSPAAVCIADRISLLRKQDSNPTKCRFVEALVGNEQRCLKPKDAFRDCPDCPEIVVVAAGSFTMGSPPSEPERSNNETQVRVSIVAPFAVGRYAVTFDEWDACVSDGGCNGHRPSDQGWGRGKHPVVNVNWDDAKAYAAWLSQKTGKTYRLLSEAEREYVTRANTAMPFWWGLSITPKQANYDGSAEPYKGGGSNGEYRKRTVSVDSFEPNAWGLYSVHGNVWEWTEDCWNELNNGNPGDGRARTTGDCASRVIRGGSWFSAPQNLRSANRARIIAEVRLNHLGFRLARTLSP